MGLCPSRNRQASKVEGKGWPTDAKTYTPQDAVASRLRADAPTFVPVKVEKPQWEQFLERKKAELQSIDPKQPFMRRQDGTFTSEYRKLLAGPPRPTQGLAPAAVAATGAVSADVVQAWKECKLAPKPKKEPDALRQHVLRVRASAPPPAVRTTQDDTAAAARAQRLVPFGLSDRHYLSGDEDAAQSRVHASRKPPPQREYVPRPPTPELEQAVTEVLYQLRLVRACEAGESRRYCVGLREAQRASRNGTLKAVVVAPDLERAGPALDAKLQALLASCAGKTPAVFGLSRRRLGQAIQKSATVSVVGILDTRGVQGPFDRMLALAR